MCGMFFRSLKHDDLMVVKEEAFHLYQIAIDFWAEELKYLGRKPVVS